MKGPTPWIKNDKEWIKNRQRMGKEWIKNDKK